MYEAQSEAPPSGDLLVPTSEVQAEVWALLDVIVDADNEVKQHQEAGEEAAERGDNEAADAHAEAVMEIVATTPGLSFADEQITTYVRASRALDRLNRRTPTTWVRVINRCPARRSARSAKRHAASTTRRSTSGGSDPDPSEPCRHAAGSKALSTPTWIGGVR